MTAHLPVGVYQLRLVGAFHRDTASGRWQIVFVFAAVHPPYTGEPVRTVVGIQPILSPYLARICAALGCTEDEIIFDPECRLGTEVLAHVSVRTLRDSGVVINEVQRIQPAPVAG